MKLVKGLEGIEPNEEKNTRQVKLEKRGSPCVSVLT